MVLDRDQARDAHGVGAEDRLVDGGAPRAGVHPARVRVVGLVEAEGDGHGVHLPHEGGDAPGVPAGEVVGDVAGRRDHERLEQLALGEALAGDDLEAMESPSATAWIHASWSAAVIVKIGPDPSPRGWSRSTMTAVMTLVTLAIGTEVSSAVAPGGRPRARTRPTRPSAGNGNGGAAPGSLVTAGTSGTSEGSRTWTGCSEVLGSAER